MGIDIDEKEFVKLPQKGMLLVLFQNQNQTNKRLETIDKRQSVHESGNKVVTYIGGIWLFALTVYVGAKRFIPFI